MKQPAVTSTTTSITHQLCTFIHLRAHSHTNYAHTHSHTQLLGQRTPSLPYCVFLPPRATWQRLLSPAALQGSNHDWWPVKHMTTHRANEQMHGCAVSAHTHANTVAPHLIEVSGASADHAPSWKWCSGVKWRSGSGGGFILKLPTDTPLLFFFFLSLNILCCILRSSCCCCCCWRKIKVIIHKE